MISGATFTDKAGFYVVIYLAALLLSLTGCIILVLAAKHSKAFSSLTSVEPVSDRWHKQKTPGLGGIAIGIATVLVLFTAGITLNKLTITIFVASLLLLLAGAFDDIKSLAAKTKFGLQCLSAGLVLMAISFHTTGNVPSLQWAAALVWLLAIINGINLLDNMDGLAAGIALIACAAIALLLSVKSENIPANQAHFSQLLMIYIALAGALSGFLIINFNPAKLFMGDAGSLWIGLLVGTGALLLTLQPATGLVTATSPTGSAWILAMTLCVVPLTDTAMVVLTRCLRRQSPFQGGRDHLSHRLVAIGFSERASVALLWMVALIAAGLVLIWPLLSTPLWYFLLCSLLASIALGTTWLCRNSDKGIS